MGKEIERKFLVKEGKWQPKGEGELYRQGYLSTVKERVVRVRSAGRNGFLTIKGATVEYTRLEFEYPIPLKDAEKMLDALCEHPLIEKQRYHVEHDGVVWEIDVFKGENKGLIVAEVELENETQEFDIPDWAGQEVSKDPRYYNANLVKHPFREWGADG